MDFDAELKSLKLPRAKRSVAWEARAKVMWGDSADEVRIWLLSNDIDSNVARRIIAIATRERAATMRAKGIRDLVVGVFLAAIGGGIAIALLTAPRPEQGRAPVRIFTAVATLALIGAAYGAHLTWRGLDRVVFGAGVQGGVSDPGH